MTWTSSIITMATTMGLRVRTPPEGDNLERFVCFFVYFCPSRLFSGQICAKVSTLSCLVKKSLIALDRPSHRRFALRVFIFLSLRAIGASVKC